MDLKKILGFVILFLFSLNVVNATTQDDLRSIGMNSYYAFENNSINDETGNFTGATTNTLNTSGILGSGRSFNGAAQKVDLATLGVSNAANPWTVNLWIKTNTLAKTIYSMGTSGTRNNINIQLDGVSDRLRLSFSGGQKTFVATGIDDNTFHMVTCLFNGTTVQDHTCYMDGTLLSVSSIGSSTGAMNYANSNYGVGYFSATATQFFLGTIDEVSIWSRQLDQTEVTYLYNSGTPTIEQRFPFTSPSVPSIVIDDISLVNDTIINNSSLDIGLNLSATNTNININTTLFLSNGSSYSIGTNTQNVSFTLNNIQESTLNLWIFSENNETNVTSNNFTYTFDFTVPIINNNILPEYDSYIINFNSSCSDLNLLSCEITLNNQTVDLNVTTFTFTLNGNLTYNITGIDKAGNSVNDSGVIFINPFQTWLFRNSITSVIIDDYTFGSYTSNNSMVQIKTYDLGLGNSTLLFTKFGFNLENFTVTLNRSSDINDTLNVTPVTLTIQVFDESNPTSQLTFNATLDNSTNILLFQNQFNFSQQIDNITSGSVSILIESDGFASRKIFTSILSFSSLSFTIYLLNSSLATPVIFQVTDVAGALPIENDTLNFFKLIGNATQFIGQARTDSQGTTFFNMGINDEYEIVSSSPGFVTLTFNSVPGRILYNVLMNVEDADTELLFNQFGYKFNPSGGYISELPFNGSVLVSDTDSSLTLSTFTINGNNTFFTTSSSNPSGGTFGPFLVINFSEQYLFNLTIIRNGQSFTFLKTYTFLNETNSTLSLKASAEQLQGEENNADRVAMIVIIYVIFVGIGTLIGGPLFGTMLGLIPISFFVMVGWFSATNDVTNAGAGILLGLFTVMGGLFFNR